MPKKASKYAAFRRFGALGGKKAAAAMTPEQRTERAARGGKVTAASMTPEQKAARAAAGAAARIAKAEAAGKVTDGRGATEGT
jgi:hypothetical protein